ncbi:MAG: META domain-containing protein [Prevotellaceae bacterium]|jgi:heat shock protein HslJ|nr:META domain-containing protein [Prevotellaceae bacterium]
MKKYWVIITVSACILAACGSQKKINSNGNVQPEVNSNENMQDAGLKDTGKQKDLSFENTKWILKSIDGNEVEMLPDKPAYIIFSDDERISGFLGCNGFSGSYYLSGDILKLDNIISTQKGCFPKNPEKLFSSVLSRVDACVVIGNKLVFTQMGKEIAAFEGYNE